MIEKADITLLYVEDDVQLRGLYGEVFQNKVKHLIIAENGEEGLKAFMNDSPDIVLTDIRMPVMSGIEMSRHIRQIDKKIPIIMTSGSSESEFLFQAIELGVTRYILKPFQHEHLELILDQTIEYILLRKAEIDRKKELQEIMDTQKSIILLANIHGVERVNKVFCNVTGYKTLEEFQNNHQCICDLFVMEEQENYLNVEGFISSMKQGTPSFINGKKVKMYCNIHQEERIFLVDITPFVRQGDFVVTLTDITELEEEIKKNKEKDYLLFLQSKHAQMGEMISMIAHQWRQPLNAISASSIRLSMLNTLNDLAKEEITSISKFIQKETQDMSQIINDFMNFFKPVPQTSLVSLDNILSEIRSLIEGQLKSKGIILIVNGEDIHTPISGYRQELSNVLINLIVNAKDAFDGKTVESPTITVELSLKEGVCTLIVRDNAGGVPEAIMNKIFNPYFTTKEQGKGTGIGLYMSKRIVEEILNGSIEVYNRGGGAVFELSMKLPEIQNS